MLDIAHKISPSVRLSGSKKASGADFRTFVQDFPRGNRIWGQIRPRCSAKTEEPKNYRKFANEGGVFWGVKNRISRFVPKRITSQIVGDSKLKMKSFWPWVRGNSGEHRRFVVVTIWNWGNKRRSKRVNLSGCRCEKVPFDVSFSMKWIRKSFGIAISYYLRIAFQSLL